MREWAVAILLLALVTVGAGAGAGTVAQVGSDTVGVGLSTGETPDGSTDRIALSNGSTTTVSVVVEGASGGVGSTELSLSVDDPAVFRITDIRLGGNGTVTDTSVGDNGTSASASAIGLEQRGDATTVARVDILATGNGTASLALTVDEVGARDGRAYDVNVTDGSAAIAVGDGANAASEDNGEDGNDRGFLSGVPVSAFALGAVLTAGYLLYRRGA